MPKIDLSEMMQGLNQRKQTKNSFAMIYDEIDSEVAKAITQWILEENFGDENRPDVLNLLINSPGGSLTDAFAIVDIMESSHIPIRTIGLGQIASSALMIFLAGAKGQRILTPNTSILSHRFSAGMFPSKEHELFAIAKEFDMTSQRMIAHYRKYTGLTEKVIKDQLLPPQDIYLSAKEALELKLCDKIATLN